MHSEGASGHPWSLTGDPTACLWVFHVDRWSGIEDWEHTAAGDEEASTRRRILPGGLTEQ